MSNNIKNVAEDSSTPQHIGHEKLIEFVKDYIDESIDGKFEQFKPEVESRVGAFVSEFKEEINDDINNTKKELNKVKNNVINTLAIFAAFFTFVSTSFNIFSLNISIYSAMSLAVILWLLLIGFSYMINVFISRDHTSIKAWIPVIVLAAMSMVILFSNYNFHYNMNGSKNDMSNTQKLKNK